MKVITAEWLREQSVCPSQLRKFRKLFPEGARITFKNIQLAAHSGLDILWFAWEFLLDNSYDDLYDSYISDILGQHPHCFEDMRYKAWRDLQLKCVRPLWEAIKLDRQSK